MLNTDIKQDYQLLRAKDVAALLNLSRRSIWRLHAMGKLPLPVKISGAIRWVSSDIAEWIKKQCPSREAFESQLKAEGK